MPLVAAFLLLAAAQQGGDRVICQVGQAKPQPCMMRDRATSPGQHRISFSIGRRTILFEGRRQSGWWSGTLDGRPAMGFERNRGYTLFMTRDLSQQFAWWYPGSEHGSY